MPKSRLRNLKAHEIVGQVLHAKQKLDDFASPRKQVDSIVMMGMGEPLLNWRNVRQALACLLSEEGFNFSKRSITLSTSGIVPAMYKLAEDREVAVKLAVSLHAVTDELRDTLVPINKQYPIASLIEACRRYTGRRITFEYVMLKGVNDSMSEARELVRLLKGIPSLVNLIPFNPWDGSEFESSSAHVIQQFAAVVELGGVDCTVRWPKGRKIGAACGQLAAKHELDWDQ